MKHFDTVKFDLHESANKRRIQLYADVFWHDEVEYFMEEYDKYEIAEMMTYPFDLGRDFEARIKKGGFRVPCGSPLSRAREKSARRDTREIPLD